MAYVLAMAALQICHPVTKFVQMISNNWLLHAQIPLTPASNERDSFDPPPEPRYQAFLSSGLL
jgi:hypothetical protein